MKLEKRDVAECLGLVYNGQDYNVDDEYCYVFDFKGKEITIGSWFDIDDAWEEAASLVLEPLVELLKSKL